MTDEQKQALNTMFITAVEKGVIVPTLEDENILRAHLSFPAKDLSPEKPEEEITEEVDVDVIEKELQQSKKYEESYDKRVNYRKIDKDLDQFEKELIDEARIILDKQMTAVMTYVTRKIESDKFNITAIENLDLKYKGELTETFKDISVKAYESGKKEMKKEIPKNFLTGVIGSGIAIKGYEQFIKAKAGIDVRVISSILYEELITYFIFALRTGATISDMMIGIEKVFSKFNSSATTINPKTAELNYPYRLEAIARTTTNGAYNYGRRWQMEQPILENVVIGYHLSPILDERTTDICQFVARYNINIKREDQTSIAKLMPPLHWNCRTLITSILSIDEPIEFTAQSILGELGGLRQVS
jgi:hypothetical protein